MINQGSETAELSGKNKAGLVLCGLLGAADVASLAALGQRHSDSAGPPTAVLVAAAVLGLVTLVTVILTWRTGSRLGARITAVARILSALTSVPAFFVNNVGSGFIAAAGAAIIVTVVAIWLLLSRPGQT
jgi:hypothetical protein